jgi:hypothetical protein
MSTQTPREPLTNGQLYWQAVKLAEQAKQRIQTDPEPFGHTPICRWIETRELDPTRCDKCRWLARHNRNHS